MRMNPLTIRGKLGDELRFVLITSHGTVFAPLARPVSDCLWNRVARFEAVNRQCSTQHQVRACAGTSVDVGSILDPEICGRCVGQIQGEVEVRQAW